MHAVKRFIESSSSNKYPSSSCYLSRSKIISIWIRNIDKPFHWTSTCVGAKRLLPYIPFLDGNHGNCIWKVIEQMQIASLTNDEVQLLHVLIKRDVSRSDIGFYHYEFNWANILSNRPWHRSLNAELAESSVTMFLFIFTSMPVVPSSSRKLEQRLRHSLLSHRLTKCVVSREERLWHVLSEGCWVV